MKKYIAVTIFSLAVLILSICARNLDLSEDVSPNVSQTGQTFAAE